MEAKLLVFAYDYIDITDDHPSWDYTSIPLSDVLLYASDLNNNIPSFRIAYPNRVVHLMGELAKLLSYQGAFSGW